VLRHNQFFGFGGTGILPVSDGRDARTTRKINCDGALERTKRTLVLRHNQFFGFGGTGILPVSDGRDARTTRKINCDGALERTEH
jgi:hypothetical protein